MHILNKRIGCVETINNSSVYTELYEDGALTPSEFAMCNGARCHFKDKVPENTSHFLVPFVVFALSKDSPMRETKETFEALIRQYTSNGGRLEKADDLFKFCDCFYYEWKKYYSPDVEADEYLNLEIPKGAIRTGNAQYLSLFNDALFETPAITIADVVVNNDSTSNTNSSDSEKYESCKNGEYILNECWTLEQETHIPKLSTLDNFVPNESYFTLVDLIHSELSTVQERLEEGIFGVEAIGKNFVNAILVGKPGTGKTSLANALAATFGMPVRTITVSKNAEEDLYQGMTKVADGGFKFVETPFLDIYKNGGIILLEEFNLSDPAVLMGALGQAIEAPFILYEDGYKEVRRNPYCVIISTMNTGTQGSREPSEAFTSRSADVFMLDDPEEEQFIQILQKSGYEERLCKRVYMAYEKIIKYLTGSSVNAEDVALSVTLRHCLACLRQMKIGRSFKLAIKNSMIGTIAIKDLALARQVYQEVIEPMVD